MPSDIATPPESSPPAESPRRGPFHFLLRGLAIILPPVLTLLIIIWVCQMLNNYILKPTTGAVRFVIAEFADESLPARGLVRPDPWMPELDTVGRRYLLSDESLRRLREERDAAGEAQRMGEDFRTTMAHRLADEAYVPMLNDRAVPYADYVAVARRLPPSEMPRTSRGIYMELVTVKYFRSLFHLSAAAIALSILLLYFVGRLVTVRLGAWMLQKFENGVMARVPLVSRVYSSVKQVTDFFFTERTVEYNRVVAVEYPRRGMWSLGFVTSDSLLEITAAAGQPLVAVLMPTSPMPMTGFTVNVPRSEIIDLNVTIDQAFQFCLSCGVLVPPQQKVTPEALQAALARRLQVTTAAPRSNGDERSREPQSSVPSEKPAEPDAEPRDEGVRG